MKLKRICALALCSALCAGLVTLTASADNNTAETYDGSLTVDKTAAANSDGTYTVSLEASLKEVACDIVLVVDQSGSMNEKYMQEDSYWDYGEAINWQRDWNDNLPPFGTGIFTDDKAHQGPFFVYDKNDDEYYELERVWVGRYDTGTFAEYAFVKYRYVDASGETHWFGADNVTGDTQYYYRTAAGGETYSKMDIVQSEIKSLTEQVAKMASDSGLEHRIAVVGFGSGDKYQGERFNYETTGLYNGSTFNKGENFSGEQYAVALKSVQTQKEAIQASVNALFAKNLPSLHELGLKLANGILSNNGDSTRKKIVVVITDGAPGWTGAYDADCATSAITQANALKDQGATIYTINMAEAPDSNTTAFMKNISSSGCYTLATKKEAFESAIASVKAGIAAQSALPLDTDTELVDTLSQYFKFADTPNVRYAWVENGGEAEYTSVPVAQYSISNKTITLNGFDFQTHISNDTKTEKLIVQFEIEPETGFLGGNDVPTNKDTSAIKNDGETYLFPVPKVDVAIPELTVTAQDKNVYLTNTLTSEQMKDNAVVKFGDTTLDFTANNYGLDEWQVAFIKDIEVTAPADKTNLTADTTYKLGYTITSKTGTAKEVKEDSNEAKINVFKPELTYDNYTVYLGGSDPAFESKTITWKHGNTAADTTEMGAAPTLSSYTYSQSKDFTDCNENVYLTGVKIGTTSVIDYVTAEAFTVHVLKPTLSATDTTIYYGNPISLGSCMGTVTWSDANKKHNADSKGYDTAPTPNYSYTVGGETVNVSYSPDDCKTVTAAWTLGKENEKFEKTFTVHVAKPSFTTDDVTIYRGNDTNLKDRVKVTKWECKDKNAPALTGSAPTPEYTFTEKDGAVASENVKTYKPTDCTELTVTATSKGKDCGEIGRFTVHVLQPVFTVSTQDVWADYKTDVDLATNCVSFDSSTGITWADTNSGIGHTAPDADVTKKPVFDTVTYTFGSDAQTYSVTDADKAFNLTAAKFTFKNGYEQTETYTNKSFTVYVNKFQLTINKEWVGADCYKQDAIFTVAGGKNSTDSFKVVIPKEKTSVTIGGLLCGQTYTVTEDGNWSWRWTADSEKTVSHGHNGVISTKPQTGCDQTVEIKNTLNQQKTLWLSGDWWCQNTYGKSAQHSTGRKKSN